MPKKVHGTNKQGSQRKILVEASDKSVEEDEEVGKNRIFKKIKVKSFAYLHDENLLSNGFIFFRAISMDNCFLTNERNSNFCVMRKLI